ncbi:MAG: acyl-CoA dehydrogenase family protein [Myxococcales bacterium]|nr:acyl-CoA dehydrogenase family protein [Myxococcales bacterium]
MRELDALLAVLLTPTEATDPGLVGFLDAHDVAHSRDAPIDRALLGGAAADRLGYAFVVGYHAAMAAMLGAEAGRRPALCVTEEGAMHPRRISVAVRDGQLHGTKRFVTCGEHADVLWVLASAGWDGDRHVLVLVPVDPRAEGVALEGVPPMPVAPELPHARVIFDGAAAAGMGRTDAWSSYVAPFRTHEDLHVLAAVLGYQIRRARRAEAPPACIEALLALVPMVRGLARASAVAACTHLALGGLDRLAREAFASVPDVGEEGVRWQRDRPLLDLATGARRARLDKARRTLR